MSDDRNFNDAQIDSETGFVTDGAPVAAHAQAQGTEESLGEVRRILLGPLSGEMQQQLATMRNQLDQSIRELEGETTCRTAELARRITDEVDRWNRAVDERHEAQARELKEAKREIEKKVRRLSDDLEQKFEQLTARFEEWSTRMSDELLPAQADQLRSELVDRGTLSSMFSEIALGIGGSLGDLAGDPSQTEADLEALLGSQET